MNPIDGLGPELVLAFTSVAAVGSSMVRRFRIDDAKSCTRVCRRILSCATTPPRSDVTNVCTLTCIDAISTAINLLKRRLHPLKDIDSIHLSTALAALSSLRKERPGLREALAAVRAGDTIVVTKLDRLARSLPDARDIIEDLTKRNVKLSIGGSIHDPTAPVGRLLFNVLAMVAEFESDLIRARTREGMRVAKAKGRLRGKQPKLTKTQEAHLVSPYKGGHHTTTGIAELFKVARSTVYRIVHRSI
jgi:hypothetical protein